MNSGSTILGVIFACFALLLVLLAYLIKYKKQINIIAGYDEQTCTDKDGLANHVGGVLLVTGGIAFSLAVAVIRLPGYEDIMMGTYGLTIFAGAMTAAIGGSKYKM